MTKDKRLNSPVKGYFKFGKLEVWKDAREFTSLVYKVTSSFPTRERFGLVDQIRRAAVSVVLNIAEGSTKGSDREFRKYLKMSQGSINEVVTGMFVALDQKFISQIQFEQVYDFALRINSRLNALIKSISP
ncbi:four helix bundle protein [Candidatus Curtissbacteria bacterium]|nr:four helix bundle protein [Candidatus Curtissbacteria bacterium]